MDQVTPNNGVVTVDLSRDFAFEVNLNANVTSIVVVGYENLPGQLLQFLFVQDSTGGRTVAGGAWPAYLKLAGGAVTLTTAAGKVDTVTFRRRLSTAVFNETQRSMNS